MYIPLPSAEGRQQVFKINLKSVALAEDIDWERLVEITEGYSGADLANVCREAAMMPLRRKLESASRIDFAEIERMKNEIDVPLQMEDLVKAC